MLQETPFTPSPLPLPPTAEGIIAEGLRRAKKIDVFDFVPSNYRAVWAVLAAMPRGRFCEWGSGMGIVTALAEMLGFDACGIEIAPPLAEASSRLLADFGLASPIHCGSYLELSSEADLYFTYCWPSRIAEAEARFLDTAPAGARFLVCHGAEDIRCKVRASG
jgi:hypothetical protein